MANCGTAANGGVVVPAGEDLIVGLDCPGIKARQTVPFSNRSWTYDVQCGRDIDGYDIGATVVYRLEDCLRSCAGLNYYSGEGRCNAVAFRTDLGAHVARNRGNCFLKNVTTATTSLVGGNAIAVAVLKGV